MCVYMRVEVIIVIVHRLRDCARARLSFFVVEAKDERYANARRA